MSKINKNSLNILLGSKLRVKVLKYLYRNHPETFTARFLGRAIQEPMNDVIKELSGLQSIGLVLKSRKK